MIVILEGILHKMCMFLLEKWK